MCYHAFLLTHILSTGSNRAGSCSKFSLLNPSWVAGEAELVIWEENQTLGGGEGNVREIPVPGDSRAEPHMQFSSDSCNPKPPSGINLGADLKTVCSDRERARV